MGILFILIFLTFVIIALSVVYVMDSNKTNPIWLVAIMVMFYYVLRFLLNDPDVPVSAYIATTLFYGAVVQGVKLHNKYQRYSAED